MSEIDRVKLRDLAERYAQTVAIFKDTDVFGMQRGYIEEEIGAAVAPMLSAILELLDAAPSPALTRDLVDITGIDAIERSLRADLRAAVEALEGRCHDGEGLGCEAHPCVENVGRDEVLALLADPVVVGVVVNGAGL